MPCEAMAKHLILPLFRVSGAVGDFSRIFNVDGYEVLNLNTHTEMVVLNIPLLKKQFAIED